ncbi:MAG: hypothetical protein ABJB97_07080 [Acidobacteriota bacterium]
MLRILSISLVVLLSIGALLPFADSSAHGLRQSFSAQRQHHYRHHSRAWWRRHRARLRMRRQAAALAHTKSSFAPIEPRPMATSPVSVAATPRLPSGWTTISGTNGNEMKFRTDNGSPVMAGQAALAVVAQSRPNPAYLSQREERNLLAGVAVGDLRRIVIDKMMTSGGWVTNDFQRDVAGHRVFVVTAQTPPDGRLPEKSWNFYFTEVNGRIYSLTTNTPPEFSGRMATEAESLIGSLQAGSASNR